MASTYAVGGPGPWFADDDLVNADGHQHGFEHATNGPTVDGLGVARPNRRSRFSDESTDLSQGRVLRHEDRRI